MAFALPPIEGPLSRRCPVPMRAARILVRAVVGAGCVLGVLALVSASPSASRSGEPISLAPGVVVALGDSITDGWGAPPGESWPADLARRVPGLVVVNRGIRGNTVVPSPARCPRCGAPGVMRFARDVLRVPHARAVIVALGMNDLLQGQTVARIEDGLATVTRRAHAHGLAVVGLTVTPFPGGRAFDAKRDALNAWMRMAGVDDVVVDADAAVRDAARPDRLRPAFDSGDHLHPNAAGYRAIAATVAATVR